MRHFDEATPWLRINCVGATGVDVFGVAGAEFALLTGAAVPVCLAVAAYVWTRRPRPGAVSFAAVMVTAAAWAVVETVNAVVVHPPTAPLRVGLGVGIALSVPVAWVVFALRYTGREDLVTRWSLVGAGLPAVAAVVIVATGDPLGVWRGTCPAVVAPAADCSPGGWFFAHLTYGYVLTAVGTWLVLRSDAEEEGFIARGGVGTGRTVVLVGGLAPPLLANLAWVTGRLPTATVDPTTAGVAVTGAVWGYALFQSDLLTVVPGTSRLGEQTAIDDLSDGVVVLDSADRVVTLNRAAVETFGRSAVAVRGESVDRLLGDDFEVTPGVQTVETETETGQRALEVTVSGVSGTEGGRVGHALVVRDVTQRIQREQQLEALNRVLRHNLRNDMNVVNGYAVTLSDRLDGTDAEMAERIAEQSAGLIELGSKVRQMEQVTEGEVGDDPFRVVDVLQAVADEVTAEHGGQVRLHAPDDLWVDADRLVLRTVFSNLVDNALAHTDADDPHVEVVARGETDRWVEVEVRDDGPGIPDQELEALRSGETALRHGSGLGLWVVNWGVTGLGGDLEFVETDDGTTVVVRLADRVPAPGGPDESPVATHSGSEVER